MTPVISRRNEWRFWQIFVEALEQFLNHFIQSKTSASTHEYSESNHASKYVMLLSNFAGYEHRRICPVSAVGFRHQQLVLLPLTVILHALGEYVSVCNLNFDQSHITKQLLNFCHFS